MPTLVRLLTILLVIAGSIFAVMAALVTFVQPRQHTITVAVPLKALEAPKSEALRVESGTPGGGPDAP